MPPVVQLSDLGSPSTLASGDKYLRLYYQISNRCSRLRLYYSKWIMPLEDSKVSFESNSASLLTVLNDEIEQLTGLLERLVSNNISFHTYSEVYSSWVCFPRRFEDHCVALFGGPFRRSPDFDVYLQYNEAVRQRDSCTYAPARHFFDRKVRNAFFRAKRVESFQLALKRQAYKSRRSEVLSRLHLEADLRIRQGWYCVFNTLTVSPDSHDEVFCANSSKWMDYIRRVDRFFAHAAGYSDRERSGKEYHSYFAVVERGSKSGRLHLHVLHFFKVLPVAFSDPNTGLAVANRREVDYMKRFWSCGFSSPVAVRFDGNDAFSKARWRWPSKEGMPLMSSPPGAILGYVSKYLAKDLEAVSLKQGGRAWRVKWSRNLGRKSVQSLVERLPQSQRIFLLQSRPRILLQDQLYPRRLLSRLLLRSLLVLKLKTRSLWREFRNFLEGYVPPLNLLRRFLDEMKVRKFSPERFGGIPTRGSPRTVASDIQDFFVSLRKPILALQLAGASYSV